MVDSIYGVGSYGVDSYASDKVNLIGVNQLYIGCELQDGKEANGVFDEFQLFYSDKSDAEVTALFNATQPSTFSDHILLAHFDKNIAGGNLILDNLNIDEWRIYRKKSIDNQYKLIKKVDNLLNSLNTFYDYEVTNNFYYDYALEGSSSEGTTTKFEQLNRRVLFNGVWLIDMDTLEAIQLRYNIGDINITIETDVSEVKTFSQFPQIRRGQYRTRRGSVSCDVFNKDSSLLYKDINKLERLSLSNNLLLKIDTGDIFYANINNINYTRNPETNNVMNVKFDFVQTGVIE